MRVWHQAAQHDAYFLVFVARLENGFQQRMGVADQLGCAVTGVRKLGGTDTVILPGRLAVMGCDLVSVGMQKYGNCAGGRALFT